MKFQHPLIHGYLVKRYKRFLSDIRLDSGEVVVAHCTNSGSMKSCIEEGAEVYLSQPQDPNRKTKYTWEMIKINDKWVGINTMHPNLLASEAIKNQEIERLKGYTKIVREVKVGESRLDIMAENDRERCFVEVKNVTMKVGDKALFPDAVTTRGAKHLDTLMDLKSTGLRAVMLYIVQRMDVTSFDVAKEIDSVYASKLKEAISQGVEVIVMQANVSPEGIFLEKELPYSIS